MRPTALALPSRSVVLSLPILVAAFCLLWSSAFAIAKLALIDCPPLLLLTARFLIASAVLFGIAAMQGIPWHLSRRDVAALVVIGIANNSLYLGLNYVGMHGSVSAGLTALIASANPMLTAVLAAVFLSEQVTVRKIAGLLLGFAGVAFIVKGRLSGGSEPLVGVLFTLASLASLVAGTILYKRLAPNGGLMIGVGMQNLAGGLALLPFAFTLESLGDVTPTWRLAVTLGYLTLLGSVTAYLLWLHLVNRSGAMAASSYHFMMPPLGMLFGWLLLGEHVAFADLIGILPVAIGIYLVTRPAAKRAAA